MATPAGQLTAKATFMKRALMPASAGTLRSGFETAVLQWVSATPGKPADIGIGTWSLQGKTTVLGCRLNRTTATIGPAWQVAVANEVYEVQTVDSVGGGMLRISAQSAPTRKLYANEMELRGEAVDVARFNQAGQLVRYPARARIKGYQPNELVGGITQGDRNVLLLAEDLETNGFPLPLQKNDRIVVRGKALNIVKVDDSTHRNAGVLNAYDLQVTGA